MFSKNLPKLGRSLALRLTLWYAGIFALSSLLAFALIYALTATFVAERTDADMLEDITDLAQLHKQEGIQFVKKEMSLDTQGGDAERFFFRLWTSDGGALAATDLDAWPELAAPQAQLLREVDAGSAPHFATLPPASREHHVRTIVGRIAPGVVMELGRSLEEDEAFLAQVRRGFPLALGAVLLLGAPVGWFMARRALRGVKEVTRTANEIIGGALDRRVPLGASGDELDQLARTFNTMLDRVQTLVGGMRDMADNLAHDLRSPLGRIRAAAEMSLSDAHDSAAREALAANAIEECDRLLELINTTLDIAEADAGAAKLNLSWVDLATTVRNACDIMQPLAEDNDIALACGVPALCNVQGDRQRLQRVIANLLDNALKYTPRGGKVDVTLSEQADGISVSVEDNGPGIASEELPRIFDRFYRCDQSRSRHGVGLGLSLARAFARAHGGDITVTSTPGIGSVFVLALPRAPRAFVAGSSLSSAVQPQPQPADQAALA